MPRTTIGWIMLVIGAVLAIVSLAADSIGVGGAPGFGFKQIGGTVAGAILAVAGFWMTRTKKAA